jgi:hypothetical protein
MAGFYNYDTRGASYASQIINLERMVGERDDEIYRLNQSQKQAATEIAAALKRLASIAEGVSIYGSPDKGLLAERLEAIYCEIDRITNEHLLPAQ